MDSQLQNEVCLHLGSYLMKEFSYKTQPTSLGVRNSFAINADRRFFHLYLRCLEKDSHWPSITLVIVRWCFLEQRAGHGTNLVDFLIEISLHLGISYIGIESANQASAALALKKGFSYHESERDLILKI